MFLTCQAYSEGTAGELVSLTDLRRTLGNGTKHTEAAPATLSHMKSRRYSMKREPHGSSQHHNLVFNPLGEQCGQIDAPRCVLVVVVRPPCHSSVLNLYDC